MGGEILRFDVVRRASDNSRVPAVLRPLPALALSTVDCEVDPISAGETVKVQAAFTGYTGRYVYHCHFLEHSWIGMMAQLEIVP